MVRLKQPKTIEMNLKAATYLNICCISLISAAAVYLNIPSLISAEWAMFLQDKAK